MTPYIQMIIDPINSYNLSIDDTDLPLYHVIVSEGKLKMIFLITIDEEKNNRGFKTLRCESLVLTGPDENKIYLEQSLDNSTISSDHTIVNSIFSDILNKYGIELLKVNFHNYEFFESDTENSGFKFNDIEKYNKLKNLISKKCAKMMLNTK